MPVVLNDREYRPNTTVDPVGVINFMLTQGGLGDYVCYLSALEWIARTQPQVIGRIFAPSWFIEVVQNVVGKYPNWRVKDLGHFDKKDQTRITVYPSKAPISRVGAHSLDLGFIYYCHMTPPPEDGKYYVKLDLTKVKVPELPIRYAVMTPVASWDNKRMAPRCFNGIKNYLVRTGITPVFLGNENFHDKRKVEAHSAYDYRFGESLLGKTTLLEAAKIMESAQCVIGIDNGLLHLAATTNVPIVYGYTISSVEHTKPRREDDLRVHNIYPDLKSLSCTFCQSRMRHFVSQIKGTHDFKTCLYRDDACIETIANPEDWIRLIDRAIAEK